MTTDRQRVLFNRALPTAIQAYCDTVDKRAVSEVEGSNIFSDAIEGAMSGVANYTAHSTRSFRDQVYDAATAAIELGVERRAQTFAATSPMDNPRAAQNRPDGHESRPPHLRLPLTDNDGRGSKR